MRRKREGGFTVAEVIIAGIIIAVVYISATQTVMLANRRSATARLRTNAPRYRGAQHRPGLVRSLWHRHIRAGNPHHYRQRGCRL